MGDSPRIAVIDTGICNLRSVTKALEAVGASPRVVRTPAEVAASGASGLVLPGVGALRDCVAALRASKLDNTVVPLMATLNLRFPVAVQYSSAKCKRTVYEAPAVRLGRV